MAATSRSSYPIRNDTWKESTFYSREKMSKFITKFGQTGSQSISVIGSFLGTSRQQIQNIVIQCDGQDIQGPRTIGSLMDAGILAEGGIKRNNYNHGVIYIGQIASIMPFSPMLFIEGLRGTVDENDLKHRLFLPSTASIPTSLPLSLRFSHAGGLPLGPKTRLAHLAWSIRFHKAIHSSFDMRIYNLRCKNAYVYADLTDVRDLLASIEKSIVLHESEKTTSINDPGLKLVFITFIKQGLINP